MKPEDKELLLQDLCSRFSYGIKVQIEYDAEEFGKTIEIDEIMSIDKYGESIFLYHAGEYFSIEEIKPYLRPMSSMTEEECKEFGELPAIIENVGETLPNVPYYIEVARPEQIDWLNKNMFDYRGLIEQDLAIAVTKENNPYEN